MKRFLIALAFAFAAGSAFADQVDWETFQQKIFAEYPWCDYVAYSTYEQWNGDADAFIQYYKENPMCVVPDEYYVAKGDSDVRLYDSN